MIRWVRVMHLAFTVDTREQVRTFYQAALDARASCRDAPGVFAGYHPARTP